MRTVGAPLVAVAALLVANNGAGVHALTDQIRECELIPCDTSVSSDTELKLTCGGNGDVVTGVSFASFGLPQASCAAIDADGNKLNVVELNVTDGCDADKSAEVVLEACEGEEECVVELSAFALTDAGLESCGVALSDLVLQAEIECGETLDFFQILIALVIAVIGFGLGATVELHMVHEIFKSHKRALIVGFSAQFGFMPLIAYFFASVLDVDPLVAVGMILVGSCPGGVTSNLLTYYAKGSVALSIVMSSFSTLCSLFMLPLLTLIYVQGALDLGDDISIPFSNIVQALLLAIVPAALGILLRAKKPQWAGKAETAGSVLGGLFILAALVVGILDNPDLFVPANFPNVWIAGVFYQPIGCAFGFFVARTAKLPRAEQRAVCLETGVQNFVLAIAIATLSFEGCTRRVVLTFPLVATFWYLINSVWITVLLRRHASNDPVSDSKVAAIDN